MASSVKACTNSRYRKTNIVIITILSLLSCFALVMVIYNLIKGSYLFSIAWFIATILASTYVLIRINTVFATYISTDRMNLFMKNWNNDFLPYDYDNKVKILSEFIPATTCGTAAIWPSAPCCFSISTVTPCPTSTWSPFWTDRLHPSTEVLL